MAGHRYGKVFTEFVGGRNVSGFDRIPERDDSVVPPPPEGFLPVEVVEEQFMSEHWKLSDPAWTQWDFSLLSDKELLKRYHDASAELTVQVLTFDEEDHIIPRQFSQQELDAANALDHYWRAYCEVKVRSELRKLLQALVA
jgi:hypothetical protein